MSNAMNHTLFIDRLSDPSRPSGAVSYARVHSRFAFFTTSIQCSFPATAKRKHCSFERWTVMKLDSLTACGGQSDDFKALLSAYHSLLITGALSVQALLD
jgi:hypothetical protein